MASEALRALETGIDAWNRRDWDAVLATIREDIVWRTAGGIPDVDAVYEGHAGVRRFFGRFAAKGRGGIEVDGRFFQLYRFDEDSLIYDFAAYVEDDEERARREAGT